MSKQIFCSIFDKATGAYMRPFVALSEGQAVRMFVDLVNDQTHEIAKHPEDYTLFAIAEWFDRTGNIVAMEPKPLMRAHEAVAQTHDQQTPVLTPQLTPAKEI